MVSAAFNLGINFEDKPKPFYGAFAIKSMLERQRGSLVAVFGNTLSNRQQTSLGEISAEAISLGILEHRIMGALKRGEEVKPEYLEGHRALFQIHLNLIEKPQSFSRVPVFDYRDSHQVREARRAASPFHYSSKESDGVCKTASHWEVPARVFNSADWTGRGDRTPTLVVRGFNGVKLDCAPR